MTTPTQLSLGQSMTLAHGSLGRWTITRLKDGMLCDSPPLPRVEGEASEQLRSALDAEISSRFGTGVRFFIDPQATLRMQGHTRTQFFDQTFEAMKSACESYIAGPHAAAPGNSSPRSVPAPDLERDRKNLAAIAALISSDSELAAQLDISPDGTLATLELEESGDLIGLTASERDGDATLVCSVLRLPGDAISATRILERALALNDLRQTGAGRQIIFDSESMDLLLRLDISVAATGAAALRATISNLVSASAKLESLFRNTSAQDK